jgi:gamma-glutamyltranspeptidase
MRHDPVYIGHGHREWWDGVLNDRLAIDTGVEVLGVGGTTADAAIATNAVLTVTAQHFCGLGGDLSALVHERSGGSLTPCSRSCRPGHAGQAEWC